MPVGSSVVEDCEVTKVVVRDQKVEGVETSKGVIECDIFVNAAGTWARHVRHVITLN